MGSPPNIKQDSSLIQSKVQSWSQSKRQAGTVKLASSPSISKEIVALPDSSASDSIHESSFDIPKEKSKLQVYVRRPKRAGLDDPPSSDWKSADKKWVPNDPLSGKKASETSQKAPDLSELEFEARSSKDGAWYDVAMFLTRRVLSSGEPEVLVRYVGFGAEEDEWVNIKRNVRERSLPLEPSECQKIKVGDLVLCYRERRDHATHFDAHVLEIKRRLHDIRGCRCLFLIRYDHDNTEERVNLRRICHRPSY